MKNNKSIKKERKSTYQINISYEDVMNPDFGIKKHYGLKFSPNKKHGQDWAATVVGTKSQRAKFKKAYANEYLDVEWNKVDK